MGYIALIITAVLIVLWFLYYLIDGRKRKKILEQQVEDLNKRYEKYSTLIQDQKTQIRVLEEQHKFLFSTQEKAIAQLNDKKISLQNDIIKSQEVSQAAFANYQEQLQSSYDNADAEYEKLILNLQDAYNTLQDTYSKKAKEQKEKLLLEIEEIYKELNKIKETRAAALEAQRREELLKQEKDLFRVVLNQNELTTIEMINEIKPRLPEPRILCMLIWSTFYQKKLDTLCKKILGSKTVCGIYKITNISNGLCYIGQAKDIDKRWKEHVKCGLGIDTPVGNKLYQAMKEIGPENFTFELLETCSVEQLNEKEKFYIDLYQSKDFGYNSNKGIS